MLIEKIFTTTSIPDDMSPSLIVEVPEGAQAVVYHVLTNAFESPRHGCTTHTGVWFPSGCPIVFRESPSGLKMVLVINREIIDPPIAAGSDFVLEFGAVREPQSQLGQTRLIK